MSKYLLLLLGVGLCAASTPGRSAQLAADETPPAAIRPIESTESADELRKSGCQIVGEYVLSAEATDVLRRDGDEFKKKFARIDSDIWKQGVFTEENARLTVAQRLDDYIQTASDFYDGKDRRGAGIVGERQRKSSFKKLGDDQLGSALASVEMASAWSVPVEKRQIDALNAVISKRLAIMPGKAGADPP